MASFDLQISQNCTKVIKIRPVPLKETQFIRTVRAGIVTLMQSKAGVLYGGTQHSVAWSRGTYNTKDASDYYWFEDLLSALCQFEQITEKEKNYCQSYVKALAQKHTDFFAARGMLNSAKALDLKLTKAQEQRLNKTIKEWRDCRG